MSRKFLALLALIAASFAPASAYEIGSENPIKKTEDIHESITELALRCLDEAASQELDCVGYLDQLGDLSDVNHRAVSFDLDYATRWPDDPTRMLDRRRTQPKFGVTLFQDCGPYIGAGQRIDEAGMLCSSHYGRLSFFHAMEQPDVPLSTSETRSLILAGANFAFDVATREDFRQADYCHTVQHLENPLLRDALSLSADSRYCERRRKRFLFVPIGWYEPWKVQTLFAFQCGNPIGSKRCDEGINERGRNRAVAGATGAILHMIQDSYSQSHVYRGESSSGADEDGPFSAQIVCAVPQDYFDYNVQMNAGSDIHAAADSDPAIDASCTRAGRTVHDPVTATANVIRYIRDNDREGFEAYMAQHVFPPPTI